MENPQHLVNKGGETFRWGSKEKPALFILREAEYIRDLLDVETRLERIQPILSLRRIQNEKSMAQTRTRVVSCQ